MMVKKMQEAAAEKKIEAEIWAVGDADAVIDMQAYGTMNGAKVLEQALKLLGM